MAELQPITVDCPTCGETITMPTHARLADDSEQPIAHVSASFDLVRQHVAKHQRLTAIVCRSRRQFEVWCLDNQRDPRDPSLRLVTGANHARGCEFDEVVLIDGPAFLMEITQARVRRKSDA